MSSETAIRIANRLGTDVSSRRNAASIRQEACALAKENGWCDIDCNGVRSMSDGFADELFAVLVEEKGEEWFLNHIRVENATDDTRLTILVAIRDRQARAAITAATGTEGESA